MVLRPRLPSVCNVAVPQGPISFSGAPDRIACPPSNDHTAVPQATQNEGDGVSSYRTVTSQHAKVVRLGKSSTRSVGFGGTLRSGILPVTLTLRTPPERPRLLKARSSLSK